VEALTKINKLWGVHLSTLNIRASLASLQPFTSFQPDGIDTGLSNPLSKQVGDKGLFSVHHGESIAWITGQ